MLLIALGVAAFAHEPYSHWLIPGTKTLCCNDRDCRPTQARLADDGLWEAWDGKRWLPVPRDRVLKVPSPDGRSHVCEIDGTVLCFVPGDVRS